MNYLIIAAHGSRKKESNMEVAKLAASLSNKLTHLFHKVDHAFLQFSDPLLEDILDRLPEEGAKRIIIFPFFIGSGSHILVDIPELVKQAREKYPDVSFEITRHLGGLDAVEEVIAGEVSSVMR